MINKQPAVPVWQNYWQWPDYDRHHGYNTESSTSASSSWAHRGWHDEVDNNWKHDEGGDEGGDEGSWDAGWNSHDVADDEYDESWGMWSGHNDKEVETTNTKTHWAHHITHLDKPKRLQPHAPPALKHYQQQGIQAPKRNRDGKLAPTAKKRPKKSGAVETINDDMDETFLNTIHGHWGDIYEELTHEWTGNGGCSGKQPDDDGNNDDGNNDDGNNDDGNNDDGHDEVSAQPRKKRARGTKIRAGRKIQFERFVQMLRTIQAGHA